MTIRYSIVSHKTKASGATSRNGLTTNKLKIYVNFSNFRQEPNVFQIREIWKGVCKKECSSLAVGYRMESKLISYNLTIVRDKYTTDGDGQTGQSSVA